MGNSSSNPSSKFDNNFNATDSSQCFSCARCRVTTQYHSQSQSFAANGEEMLQSCDDEVFLLKCPTADPAISEGTDIDLEEEEMEAKPQEELSPGSGMCLDVEDGFHELFKIDLFDGEGEDTDDDKDGRESSRGQVYGSGAMATVGKRFGPGHKGLFGGALKLFHSANIQNLKEMEGGKLFQGTLQGNGNKSVGVAVKAFDFSISLEKESDQLAKLMSLKHRNLVPILGLVLDNRNEPVLSESNPRILLQYFPDGNLLDHLSKRENPQDFTMLGKLALDILNGCEYLHERNIVHGNLAARNVLIQRSINKTRTHYNAKISDFGISQLACSSSTNALKRFQNQKVSPIRWYPKEVVSEKICPDSFTLQSDVWSFGVVCFELMTRGGLPFGSFSEEEVRQFILKGKSPLSIHRPHRCPESIVTVMESIFKVDPQKRPTIKRIKEAFTSFRSYGIEHKSKTTGGNMSYEDDEEEDSDQDQTMEQRKLEGEAEEEVEKENVTKSKTSEDQDEPEKVSGPEENPPPPKNKIEKEEDEKAPAPSQKTFVSSSKETKQPEKKIIHRQDQGRGKRTQPPRRNTGGGQRYYNHNHRSGDRNRRDNRAGDRYGSLPPPLMSTSVAPPPPYTPSPMPSHYQFSSSSNSSQHGKSTEEEEKAILAEIQRCGDQLQFLKVEHLRMRYRKTQCELDDIMNEMAQQHIGNTVSASGYSYPPPSSSLPPPPYGDRDDLESNGSREGRDRSSKYRGARGGRARSQNRSRGGRSQGRQSTFKDTKKSSGGGKKER